MKFRLALASILTLCILSLNPAAADSVRGVFAVVLYQHAYTQPVGSGAASANITVNCGATAFSQCGWENLHGGTLSSGMFDNQQSTTLSPNFPACTEYAILPYDAIDGVDRIDACLGVDAPLFLQAGDGFVGVGPYKAATAMLTVGGSITAFDPTQVGSTILTSATFASADWAVTNDCSLPGSGATCTFSAGTASTITQTTTNLAIPGSDHRVYKITYTVSGVTGTPTAAFTSAFFNTSGNNPINLLLVNGTHTQYFQSVDVPGNFVISTTLTTGQAFTLNNISAQEVLAGDANIGGKLRMGYCTSGASPAVCGQYASGVVAIPTGVNPTLQVNTTNIGGNGRLLLTNDSTLAPAGTTCNTTAATLAVLPYVSARNNNTSFTLSYLGTISTNPLCVNYMIIN